MPSTTVRPATIAFDKDGIGRSCSTSWIPRRAAGALGRLLSGDLQGLSRSLGRRLRRERRLEAGEVRVHHLDAAALVALLREHLGEVEERRSGEHALLAARRPAGVRPGLPRTALVGVGFDF